MKNHVNVAAILLIFSVGHGIAQNTFPATGNVGIGTTSPANTLDVNGGINMDTGILNLPNGDSTKIDFYGTVQPNHSYIVTSPGYAVNLYTNGIQNMTWSSGKVGIGTTSPAQLLQVGSTYSQNPSVMIGGHDSNNSSTGSYSLLFGAWRDIESTLTSGIVATPTWTCCGGYPASGYPGVRLNALGFYTIYDPASPSTFSPSMLINANGNVGLGTTTPGAKLEVDGSVLLTSGSGATITFSDGSVQSVAWNGTTLGGDYAESIDVLGDRAEYEPGDVIVINAASPGRFEKSSKAYSKLVAGVYSTKPGLVGRRLTFERINKAAEIPMAMLGIVPTKVTTENGPIEPGDLLVSASKPGYAMKGTDSTRVFGAVLGKALGPLGSGDGVIEVMISIQ